jgi:protocatechuate 3,4-dioxygenase beta subunit
MEITLTGRPSTSGGRIVQHEISDSDGSFDFRGLDCAHFWQLSARAEGYRAFQQELYHLQAGVWSTGNFELSRGGALTGRVVDEAGSPLADARLSFDCRAEPLGVLPRSIESGLRTGILGEFRAAGLYPGSVLVRVEQPGLVPQSIEVDDLKNDETRELTIVLKYGVVARGRVVDPDGAPVAGARLSITQQRPGWSEYVHALETAPDGTFACTGLSALPMRVVGEKTSAQRALRIDVTLDPTKPDLVVRLAERFTLRGRVLDDLGRTMLTYTAGVRRIDPADPNPKPRTIDVKGKDGVFTIDDLDAGRWEVFVYGRGIVFEPARAVDVPLAAGDLVFTVRRPAVLAGRVVNADGTPAAQALVELEWDRPSMFGGTTMKEETSVTASQTGQFELTEIYPGHVRVSLLSPDMVRKSVPAIDLSSGERRADLLLRFGP